MLRSASPAPSACLSQRGRAPSPGICRSGPVVVAPGVPYRPSAHLRSFSGGPVYGSGRSQIPSPAIPGQPRSARDVSPYGVAPSYVPPRQATPQRQAVFARDASPLRGGLSVLENHQAQAMNSIIGHVHLVNGGSTRSSGVPGGARSKPQLRRLCLPPPVLAEDGPLVSHDFQRESPVSPGGMAFSSPLEPRLGQPLPSYPVVEDELVPPDLPPVPTPPGEAPIWPFLASHDLLPGFAPGVSGSASIAEQMRTSGSSPCTQSEPSLHLEDLSRIEAPRLTGLRIPVRREDAWKKAKSTSEIADEVALKRLLQSGCQLKDHQRRGVVALLQAYGAEHVFLLQKAWRCWSFDLHLRAQGWEVAELQEALRDSERGYNELFSAHRTQSSKWEALRCKLRDSKQKVAQQEDHIKALSNQVSKLHKLSESYGVRHAAGQSRSLIDVSVQTEPLELNTRVSSAVSTTAESLNAASNNLATNEVPSLKRHAAWLEQQLASIDQECNALTEALVQRGMASSPAGMTTLASSPAGMKQKGLEPPRKVVDGNSKIGRSLSPASSLKSKSAQNSSIQSPIPRRLLSPSPSPKPAAKGNKIQSQVIVGSGPRTPPAKKLSDESPPFTPPFTPPAFIRAPESPQFTPLSDSLSSVSSIAVHNERKDHIPRINFGLSQLQQIV